MEQTKERAGNVGNPLRFFVSRAFILLTSPFQAVISALAAALASLIWFVRLIRFPFLWFDMIWRTIVFGYVTYIPVCKIRFQFWDMCATGQAWEGVPFSSRHKGALLDIIHPPELVAELAEERKKKKNNNSNNNNMLLSHDQPPAQAQTFAEKVFNYLGLTSPRQTPVYTPTSTPTKKKYPAVLLFSGGAWIIGKRLWVRPMGVHFADAGFVAIPVDYRQWPFGTMGDMVDDALDSFVWVFDEIGKEGSPLENVDPDQVFVLGQSAGGHVCSLALLELARLRREQTLLAASGAAASDRPCLHTTNKGVPVAFIGLSGMFDLLSTQAELEKKGLHKKVLQSMTGYRPLIDFCARSKSKMFADVARSMLPLEEEQEQEAEEIMTAHRRSFSSNSTSGEICDHDKDPRARFNKMAAAAAAASSSSSPPSPSLPSGVQQNGAVHFLPHFSLFMHGDADTTAPAQQAINTCATYNDAAARHSDELVGDDFEWTKHTESLKTAKDPFYILTAKAKKASALADLKLRHHSRTSSTLSDTPGSSSNNGNGMVQEKSFTATRDDVYSDRFEGSRSMFMGYPKATHTSLIVQDFFRRGVAAPVVVAVLALLRSLNELSEKHRHAEETRARNHSSVNTTTNNSSAATSPDCAVSPQISATLFFPSAAHSRSNSNFCEQQQQQPSSVSGESSKAPLLSTLKRGSSNNSSSAMPATVKSPLQKPPMRVAQPSYAMVDLFQKNYLAVENSAVRDENRPVIWDVPMNIANKISAF